MDTIVPLTKKKPVMINLNKDAPAEDLVATKTTQEERKEELKTAAVKVIAIAPPT